MGSAPPGLDPELIRRVHRIEIRTRRLVAETLSGTYLSAFRGRGMEFTEVREYQPGEDVRTIDWNVTARSSRPERKLYVKVHAEEREMTVLLMVDLSGSGSFGTGERLKREVLAEIAALLAFAAIRNRDRVGLIRFSDTVERFVPPRRGRVHALRVIRDILAPPEAGRGTDLALALGFLRRVQRRPAVVFLLSDMIAPAFERELRLVSRRHDIVALEVFDPAELSLPRAGLLTLEDPETGHRRLVDLSSSRVRETLRGAAENRRERTRQLLAKAGVDLVSIDASLPYEKPLLRYFHARAARIRR